MSLTSSLLDWLRLPNFARIKIMVTKSKSVIVLAAMLLVSACSNQAEQSTAPQANSTKSTGPSADMLLSEDGGVDDKRLAEAQHINMAINKDGLVLFQGIPGPDGKVKDHQLDAKDSKEILLAIQKVNQGGDKEYLTKLIQSHVTRIQTGL